MTPWFSRTKPREMYSVGMVTPRSPVMQDSLHAALMSFVSLTSLPSSAKRPAAELVAVKPKAAKESAQKPAMLCLVMWVFLVVFLVGLGGAKVGTRRC